MLTSVKRTWWIVLVIASFGFLSFVGLLVGWRIRPARRDLLWSALAAFAASLTGILLIATGEKDAGNMVIAVTWLVAIFLAVMAGFSAEFRLPRDAALPRRRPLQRFTLVGASDPRLEWVGGQSSLAGSVPRNLGVLLVGLAFVFLIVRLTVPDIANTSPARVALGTLITLAGGVILIALGRLRKRQGVMITDREVVLAYGRETLRLPIAEVVEFVGLPGLHATTTDGNKHPLPGLAIYATPFTTAGISEAIEILNDRLAERKAGVYSAPDSNAAFTPVSRAFSR